MSSDWDELTIDDLKAPTKNAIAMGPFGSRIRASNFVNKGIPVIKGGNLNGDFISEDNFDYLTEEKATELQSSNAYRRDIVITHRGTIGQVGIIPDDSRFERYVVSQSQLKVTLDQDKVVPRRFKWNSSKNLCQYSAKYWHEEKTWTATRYCYWDWGFSLPGN